MPNKLTSLTGFGEGDPKPEKKGAKAKALSAKMGKGMSHHQKMEARGMRYQAAKMPENYTSMSQADRIAYYKKNKGSYVSNEVDSKTGKYKNTY